MPHYITNTLQNVTSFNILRHSEEKKLVLNGTRTKLVLLMEASAEGVGASGVIIGAEP